MAYRTAFAATLEALEAVADATAILCAAADAPLEADTAKDASLIGLADTDTVLAAETENAPMQMRFASTATALVASMVTAARLTP
jgi:hypothetical protein